MDGGVGSHYGSVTYQTPSCFSLCGLICLFFSMKRASSMSVLNTNSRDDRFYVSALWLNCSLLSLLICNMHEHNRPRPPWLINMSCVSSRKWARAQYPRHTALVDSSCSKAWLMKKFSLTLHPSFQNCRIWLNDAIKLFLIAGKPAVNRRLEHTRTYRQLRSTR